MISQK